MRREQIAGLPGLRTFRQKGSLEVTEVEPLVAYVLSVQHVRYQFDGERLDALREAIADRISTRGCFRVTMDAGVLAARSDSKEA